MLTSDIKNFIYKSVSYQDVAPENTVSIISGVDEKTYFRTFITVNDSDRFDILVKNGRISRINGINISSGVEYTIELSGNALKVSNNSLSGKNIEYKTEYYNISDTFTVSVISSSLSNTDSFIISELDNNVEICNEIIKYKNSADSNGYARNIKVDTSYNGFTAQSLLEGEILFIVED